MDTKKTKNENIQKILREQWLVIDASHEAIIADIKKLVEERTKI